MQSKGDFCQRLIVQGIMTKVFALTNGSTNMVYSSKYSLLKAGRKNAIRLRALVAKSLVGNHELGIIPTD